eukprot:scpid103348/ scgid5070/ 
MSLGLPQHLGQQHNHHVLLLLVVVVFLSPTPGATQTPGDCGIPTVQGGSVPQLPKTTAGAIAMVTCSTGYAMNPSLPASITCQDNGTWSTSPCVPVGDHIATITEDCDVVCDRGYAYHHSTPGCKGITQVLSCDLLNCSVPAIQFGMSNAS